MEMLGERGQALGGLGQRLRRAAIHFEIRADERAEQPGPYCALVVSSIAAALSAFVARVIIRIARRERAQSIGRQQFSRNHLHHRTRLIVGQQSVHKAHGEDLVGTNGGVAPLSIDYVVQTAGRRVPEQVRETGAQLFG